MVDRLLAAQQFDQALKMCHYVLNPYAAWTNDKRFWQFLPFKEINTTNMLENCSLDCNQTQQTHLMVRSTNGATNLSNLTLSSAHGRLPI